MAFGLKGLGLSFPFYTDNQIDRHVFGPAVVLSISFASCFFIFASPPGVVCCLPFLCSYHYWLLYAQLAVALGLPFLCIPPLLFTI